MANITTSTFANSLPLRFDVNGSPQDFGTNGPLIVHDSNSIIPGSSDTLSAASIQDSHSSTFVQMQAHDAQHQGDDESSEPWLAVSHDAHLIDPHMTSGTSHEDPHFSVCHSPAVYSNLRS